MKTKLNSTALYWAQFNNFELRLSGEAVNDIAQPGPSDEAVAYWVDRVEFLRATPDSIREELKGYGAWDETKLADDTQNRHRIVWLAAHQIAEDPKPDCSEPVKTAIPYLVIGHYADNPGNRFAEHFVALTAQDAEEEAQLNREAELVICGTIADENRTLVMAS